MKKRKNNKKILILSLLFILFLTITATQAAEIQDNTTQSDSNEITLDTNDVSQNEIIKATDDHSFTELDNYINSGGNIVELIKDYKFNQTTDSKNGITIAKDNLILNGNGHTIDANGQSKIFTITGHNVTINNIILINAYSNNTYDIHDGDVINAYDGSTITWMGDNGKLTNSEIKDNDAIVVKNLDPNYSTGIININTVAGILWVGDNGTIKQTTFTNNNCSVTGSNGKAGGAILWIGDNGNIYKSTFEKNDGNARIIRFESINGTISESNFINNTQGVVYTGNNVTITKSIFKYNQATYSGSAIYVGGINNTIQDCTFEKNNGTNANAGLIYVNGVNGTISQCIVKDNIGYGNGNIYLNGANGKVLNSEFTNNTANVGAAIFTRGTNATILNSIFISNNATERCAGIYLFSSNSTINNCTFMNGTSTMAEIDINIRGPYCNVVNSNFINTTCNHDVSGACIRVYGVTNFNISGCNFINADKSHNIIYGDGRKGIMENCIFNNAGSIYFNRFNMTISNSTFINSVSLSFDQSYAMDAGNSSILNSKFINTRIGTSIDNFTIDNCIFMNFNQTNYIIGIDGKSVIISNSIFINNNASLNIRLSANAVNSIISNSTFINNTRTKTAKYNIIEVLATNCTIYDCEFYNNTGAVILNADNCTIRNSIFFNNHNENTRALVLYKKDFAEYNVFINSTNTNNNIIDVGGSVIKSNWFGTNDKNAYHYGSSYLIAKLEKINNDSYLVGGEWNPLVKIVFYDNVTNEIINQATSRPITYILNVSNIQFKGDNSKESGKIYANNAARQSFSVTTKVDNQQLETLTFNDLFISNSNSFKDLQILINGLNNNETLVLNNNYVYNPNVDNEPKIITINKTIKIIGTGSISGADQANIFNITKNNVEIEGITLTNAYNGAVIINANNTIFNNVKFTNNKATGNGGAIYANGNNTNINGAIFTGNTANDGSSIYIIGDNTILTNSIFTNNKANTGVDVYIKGIKTIIKNVTEKNTDGNSIKLDGDNTTVTNLTLDITHGKGLIVNGNNSDITNVNVIGGEGTSIETIGANTTIQNITSTNHTGGIIDAKGDNTTIINVLSENNKVGPVVKTEGDNTQITSVTDNNGEGTTIQTKGDNTKITGTTLNNHTGKGIDSEGKNVEVQNTIANNTNGDVVTIKGDNAKIDGLTADECTGTLADIKGNDAVLTGLIYTNQNGTPFVVDGSGAKINKVDAGDRKTSFIIPNNITNNSPTFELRLYNGDATGYFAVYIDNKINTTAVVKNGKSNITVANMVPGNHNITLVYSGDATFNRMDSDPQIITIPKIDPIITITGNNLDVDYSGIATYKVQVLSDGKNLTDGENITINFNGVKYTVKSINGTAILALNTAIKVGTYTITATYANKTTTNNVNIKNIINAKKLKTLKKSKKVNKVKITLAKVDGKYLVKKTIVLKIKGKKIATAKTNKKGVATLKIKKKSLKKFKPGKYKAEISYGFDTVNKKIKIKK